MFFQTSTAKAQKSKVYAKKTKELQIFHLTTQPKSTASFANPFFIFLRLCGGF